VPAELRVRVQPRAKRAEVAGERDGVLIVRVTAPPIEGRANSAACKLIAEQLGVAPSRVRVKRGVAARDKVIEVEGADQAAVRQALGIGG
jgi:uncharacterized protein